MSQLKLEVVSSEDMATSYLGHLVHIKEDQNGNIKGYPDNTATPSNVSSTGGPQADLTVWDASYGDYHDPVSCPHPCDEDGFILFMKQRHSSSDIYKYGFLSFHVDPTDGTITRVGQYNTVNDSNYQRYPIGMQTVKITEDLGILVTIYRNWDTSGVNNNNVYMEIMQLNKTGSVNYKKRFVVPASSAYANIGLNNAGVSMAITPVKDDGSVDICLVGGISTYGDTRDSYTLNYGMKSAIVKMNYKLSDNTISYLNREPLYIEGMPWQSDMGSLGYSSKHDAYYLGCQLGMAPKTTSSSGYLNEKSAWGFYKITFDESNQMSIKIQPHHIDYHEISRYYVMPTIISGDIIVPNKLFEVVYYQPSNHNITQTWSTVAWQLDENGDITGNSCLWRESQSDMSIKSPYKFTSTQDANAALIKGNIIMRWGQSSSSSTLYANAYWLSENDMIDHAQVSISGASNTSNRRRTAFTTLSGIFGYYYGGYYSSTKEMKLRAYYNPKYWKSLGTGLLYDDLTKIGTFGEFTLSEDALAGFPNGQVTPGQYYESYNTAGTLRTTGKATNLIGLTNEKVLISGPIKSPYRYHVY